MDMSKLVTAGVGSVPKKKPAVIPTASPKAQSIAGGIGAATGSVIGAGVGAVTPSTNSKSPVPAAPMTQTTPTTSALAPSMNSTQNNYLDKNFGGADHYIQSQIDRYNDAQKTGNTGLVNNITAESQKLGYQIPQSQTTPTDSSQSIDPNTGLPSWIGADIKNDVQSQIDSLNGQQTAAQMAAQYGINQNNAGLAEQLQGLKSAEAVDNQGAQELQNRRGGFYSGGLDFQLGNIGSAYANQRGQLSREVSARNQQLLDQYGNQANTIATQIKDLQTSQPDLIREKLNAYIEKQADLTGKYLGNDTMALQNQDFNQNYTTNEQTGTYLPTGAREAISSLNTLKQQAESPNITAAQRNELSAKADTLRSQLVSMGVDISGLGANSSYKNAVTAESALGTPTEGARQFNEQTAATKVQNTIQNEQWRKEFEQTVKNRGFDEAMQELQRTDDNAYKAATLALQEDQNALDADKFKYDQMKDEAAAQEGTKATPAQVKQILQNYQLTGQDSNGKAYKYNPGKGTPARKDWVNNTVQSMVNAGYDNSTIEQVLRSAGVTPTEEDEIFGGTSGK